MIISGPCFVYSEYSIDNRRSYYSLALGENISTSFLCDVLGCERIFVVGLESMPSYLEHITIVNGLIDKLEKNGTCGTTKTYDRETEL